MQRSARVAVVGTGWWATYTHIPGLLAMPDAELVALCDPHTGRRVAAAERFGIAKQYASVEELLAHERLDGVVIAVNHTAHTATAAACLDAGLPILIEKPMVLHAADARDLLARAQRHGVEIVVGYPWHFTATARAARDLVTSGALGAVQLVSSLYASMVIEFYRGNPEAYRPVFHYPVTGPTQQTYADERLSGGGQGHLQVTHSAGLLCFVTGLRAARVTAFMERWDVPVDLVDAICVRFDGGAAGTLASTGNIGVGDPGRHDLCVYGERGAVLLDMIAGTLTVRRHDGSVDTVGPLPEEERYPRFATARNFVDVLLGKAPNGSPGSVGLRCVELLDAAYRSAARGGEPIDVSTLDDRG